MARAICKLTFLSSLLLVILQALHSFEFGQKSLLQHLAGQSSRLGDFCKIFACFILKLKKHLPVFSNDEGFSLWSPHITAELNHPEIHV